MWIEFADGVALLKSIPSLPIHAPSQIPLVIYIGGEYPKMVWVDKRLLQGYIRTNVVSGELVVSKYVRESITMIAGRFSHKGLSQLRTKLKKLQYETCYIANTSQWCCVMKSGCVNDQ